MTSPNYHECKACIAREKWKSASEVTNKNNHNFRLDKTEVSHPEKTYLNEILVAPPTEPVTDVAGNPICDKNGKQLERLDFVKQFTDRIDENKISVRKNSVWEIGLVMKVSGGFEHLPEGFDLDKWKKDSMDWLYKTYGKENVVSAVLHMDEYTPHIHAVIIPITPDKRLSCRDFYEDHPLEEQWETYYEAVKQDGIYRADSKAALESEDLRRAQNALNAAGQIELPRTKEHESAEEYKKRADESYKEYGMQKHVEMTQMYREYTSELGDALAEVEKEKKLREKAEAELRIAREKQRELTREKEFYKTQLTGDGLRREELKDAAQLTAKMEEERENAVKDLQFKNAKMASKIDEMMRENNQLKAKLTEANKTVNLYNEMFDGKNITPQALSNMKNMAFILKAIQNGYPRSAELKEEMLKARKFGQGINDRDKGEISKE